MLCLIHVAQLVSANMTQMFGLSHVPDDLAAQYPDLLLDPAEHAQLFKVKYAGIFKFHCLPARIEAMRTAQWGQLDLRKVLSLETYIDMADYDRIKTICAYGCSDDSSFLLNKITMEPIFIRPFISPEGWKPNHGLKCIDEREPGDRLYWPVVFDVADVEPATCDAFEKKKNKKNKKNKKKNKKNKKLVTTKRTPPPPRADADPAYIVYTVEWRSGAVTLMPIDMVKIHLYTELPAAPWWLESYPGTTVCRRDSKPVPESAVVERWHICKERKRAAEVYDAFIGAVMPAKFEFAVCN
jgi:hypothetical protein